CPHAKFRACSYPLVMGVSRRQARDPRVQSPHIYVRWVSAFYSNMHYWRALTVHIPSHPHSRKAPAPPPTRGTRRNRLGPISCIATTPTALFRQQRRSFLPTAPGLNGTQHGEESIHRRLAVVAHEVAFSGPTIGVRGGWSTDVADPA